MFSGFALLVQTADSRLQRVRDIANWNELMDLEFAHLRLCAPASAGVSVITSWQGHGLSVSGRTQTPVVADNLSRNVNMLVSARRTPG